MLFSDLRQAPVQSIVCERRDYPEWHRGRRRYGVWLLPVDCPRILARLERARAHLGDWLHRDYRRQAHITLFVCGFAADSAQFDDDFPAERLAAQLAALAQLGAGRFELQVGGLDSYASAPFLTIADPDQRLEPLRRTLATHSTEIRQATYHPHLTAGLYARSVPRAVLQQRLSDFADAAPLALPVNQLQYATYAAAELFGRLRIEQRLVLT